jgi:hypothetical protein
MEANERSGREPTDARVLVCLDEVFANVLTLPAAEDGLLLEIAGCRRIGLQRVWGRGLQ